MIIINISYEKLGTNYKTTNYIFSYTFNILPRQVNSFIFKNLFFNTRFN